jgi:hypothetical protein
VQKFPLRNKLLLKRHILPKKFPLRNNLQRKLRQNPHPAVWHLVPPPSRLTTQPLTKPTPLKSGARLVPRLDLWLPLLRLFRQLAEPPRLRLRQLLVRRHLRLQPDRLRLGRHRWTTILTYFPKKSVILLLLQASKPHRLLLSLRQGAAPSADGWAVVSTP